MVHSAKYGRTRYTRNRTHYAPGGWSRGALSSPTSRGEFSVLRVPCVSRLRALLGLVTVVLGHIFAHKLTLVGVGLFRCFGLCRPGGVAAAVCHNFGRLVAPGWGGGFSGRSRRPLQQECPFCFLVLVVAVRRVIFF
ncbi:uncharacterized protein TM35_000041200 [Trypanosoma theileri]|uniref:Uncharacterized protein n=1 Tax=Trypanosoma theileri TaxID=67003 RepID=A0A1X0P4P5_9TRYP|nr:uncharacterized protein TM35_000041200 [Trypanosoma theileri]ORC91906.1 hypothetical protein TM35_000041200 [Trypanosoma theileri]